MGEVQVLEHGSGVFGSELGREKVVSESMLHGVRKGKGRNTFMVASKKEVGSLEVSVYGVGVWTATLRSQYFEVRIGESLTGHSALCSFSPTKLLCCISSIFKG